MKKAIKKNVFSLTCLSTIVLSGLFMTGCVSSNQASLGTSSPKTIYKPMEKAAKKIVAELNHQHPFKGQIFQITPENFYQSNTRLNLPFSEQVSEFISNEIINRGGMLSTQEVGKKPLRVMGTYHVDDTEVILSVKLREMGTTNSRDLAHAQTRLDRFQLKDCLFEPRFSRIGSTLIMLLEDHYQGFNSLKVKVMRPAPAMGNDHEMVVGEALQKFLKNSLSSSEIFSCNSTDKLPGNSTTAILTGSYGITGNKLNILLEMTGSGNAVLSSASYVIPLDNIPKEYLNSTINSLDDLADYLCRSLAKTCKKNRIKLKGEALLIKPVWFTNTRGNAVLPFSRQISQKLATNIMEKYSCAVVNQMNMNTRWLLAGNYDRNGETISMTVTLFQINPITSQIGINLTKRASVRGIIAVNRCNPEWFKKDLKGVIQCLLSRLERKSLNRIPFNGKDKNTIFVKKIKYQDTLLYSLFSDYVNRDSVEYFSNSLVFTPIKDTEKRLINFREGKTRSLRGVFPVAAFQDKTDPVAAITGAAYYTEGSYWPLNNNQIDLKISINAIDSSIVCSESIVTDKSLVDPALLKIPQNNASQYTQKLSLMEPMEKNTVLKLKIFTQKGRENLMFRKGEEIIFYVHTNKDIYLYLYNRDANGGIYRIFPNAFSNGSRIQADHVAIIPDTNYARGFKFKVQGHLGNEMVFAFASNKPLPDLPGSDKGNGVRAINIPIEEMKTRFSEFAGRRGQFLARDTIAMFTKY